MRKLLFLYELADNLHAQDGLHSALEILRSDFEVTKVNIATTKPAFEEYDYVLGHGGWGSRVDRLIKSNREFINKCGLCIGGNINPPEDIFTYDALFCETNWYYPQISNHTNARVAFGVNTDIFKPHKSEKIFDYLGVGAFAGWKRWEEMTKKDGVRLVVGEIQKDNQIESARIISRLLLRGVGVLPNVSPDVLTKLYNASKKVFIPSTDYGGGERAVWEAKACEIEVEVMPDNLKLKELVESDVKSHIDYARELLIGINK